jgi:hypothetical protein
MAEGGDERKASVGAPAVFISYASEDTEAAGRIAATLEAAGIEVWLDKTVLKTGDVWDQKIRREIRDCALFMPVISRNTQARTEGYFRLEWHLADQRTQLMAKSRPFLIPVCIDTCPGCSRRGITRPRPVPPTGLLCLLQVAVPRPARDRAPLVARFAGPLSQAPWCCLP